MCESYSCARNLLIGPVLSHVTEESEIWLSPSAKQPGNHCCRAPLVYQDLSKCHDWPVKQASVDLSIKMKGNSKSTSGNLLSQLEAQNNDIGIASQMLLTKVKLCL